MNVPNIGANFEISGYTAVQCTGDPAKDAKNFADANNLSLDEAKAILSGQFGAPKAQNETTSTATTQSTVNVDSYDDDIELVEDEEDEKIEEDEEVEEDDSSTNSSSSEYTTRQQKAIDKVKEWKDNLQAAKDEKNYAKVAYAQTMYYNVLTLAYLCGLTKSDLN